MIRRRNAHEGDSPAMLWWVRDWLTSEAVLAMPRAARSLYFDLLCHQWINGSIPADEKALAGLCGETLASFRKLWRDVALRFDKGEDGRLRNPRMEEERQANEEYRNRKSAAGSAGNAKRWEGHRNGIAEGSHSDDSATDSGVAKRSPSSSSSASSSQITPASQVARGARSSPKRESKRTERGAIHQAFIDWWCETFRDVCGSPYGFDHAKDASLVKAILDLAGGDLELAKSRALILLHAAPGWIDEGGKDLGTLRAHFNKFVSQGSGQATGSKLAAIKDAQPSAPRQSLLDMPTTRRIG